MAGLHDRNGRPIARSVRQLEPPLGREGEVTLALVNRAGDFIKELEQRAERAEAQACAAISSSNHALDRAEKEVARLHAEIVAAQTRAEAAQVEAAEARAMLVSVQNALRTMLMSREAPSAEHRAAA